MKEIIKMIFNRYKKLNNIMHNLHGEDFNREINKLDTNDQQHLTKNRFKLFLYAMITFYK